MTHAILPNTLPVLPKNEAVELTLDLMLARVRGGTMSTKAVSRSTKVSESGETSDTSETSEDTDDREVVEDEASELA